MTTAIPDEHLSAEALANINPDDHDEYQFDTKHQYPINPFLFVDLLRSTYSNNEMMEILFSDLCPKSSEVFRKQYLGKSKKLSRHRLKDFKLSSDITLLLFEPEAFCKQFQRGLPDKIKDVLNSSEHCNGLSESQDVQDMQGRLILKIRDKLRPQVDVARMLCYVSFADHPYLLNPKDFFDTGEKDDTLASSVFYGQFGLLACHIGYKNKPQYGKWESVYADACGKDLLDMLKQGPTIIERTEQEIKEDLIEQLQAESLLFKHAVIKYQETEHMLKNSIKKGEKDRMEASRYLSDLEKKLYAAQQELSAAEENHQRIKALLTERDTDIRTKIEKEFENKYREMKKTAKKARQLENERDHAKESLKTVKIKYKAKEQESKDYKRETRELKKFVKGWEQKWAKATKEPAYMVSYEIPKNRIKEFTETHYTVLETGQDYLSGDIIKGELLKNKGGNWAHKRLKKQFPSYDKFHKLEMQNGWRLIFAYKGNNSVRILDVMTHPEYDILCKSHK